MNHEKRFDQGTLARPQATIRDLIVLGFFLFLIGLATIQFLKTDYVMGTITQALPAPGDRWLVMVEEIWNETKQPVLLHEQGEEVIEKGTWIICRGTPQTVGEKSIEVLLVDENCFIFEWPTSLLADSTATAWVVDFFERHRLLAAIVGTLLLLLGSWFVWVLACLGTGCLVSCLICLAAILGHFEGYLTAPIEDYLIVIALFGFVVGCFFPIQKGSFSEFIVQRIIMLVVLFSFAGDISKPFEWLPGITEGVALILTLLNPLFGIVILSGFLLVIATGANDIAIPVLLAGLALVTLLLHGTSRVRLHWFGGAILREPSH